MPLLLAHDVATSSSELAKAIVFFQNGNFRRRDIRDSVAIQHLSQVPERDESGANRAKTVMDQKFVNVTVKKSQ